MATKIQVQPPQVSANLPQFELGATPRKSKLACALSNSDPGSDRRKKAQSLSAVFGRSNPHGRFVEGSFSYIHYNENVEFV
ncbi:MAG: hypothetical protein ACI8TQ_000526 [Planctomycetota bacterium]|jgi:hypothetical protein